MTGAADRPPCAIIYGRVSTEGQRDNTSLAHQQAVTRRWCTDHGIRVAAEAFEVESGADPQRQGLVRLQERVATGDITHLVTTRPDRVTRSARACGTLWDLAVAHRLQLVFVDDAKIIDPAADQLAVGPWLDYMLHAVIADDERRRIGSRVRAGLRQRVAEGLRLGRPPLGYRVVRQPGGRPAFVIDPEAAAAVQELFQAAAAGGSLGSLVVCAKRRWPQRKWQVPSLRRMLTNAVYAGRATTTYEGTVHDRSTQVPALIAAPLFDAVQARLADRRRRLTQIQSDTHAGSLLGGIACCTCGTRMRAVHAGGGSYRCRSVRPWFAGCGAPDVPMDVIDMAVVDALRAQLVGSQAAMVRLVDGALERLPRHLDAVRAAAAATLAAMDDTVRRLDDDLEAGRCTPAAWQVRSAALQEQREAARTALQAAQGRTVLAQLIALLGGGQRWFGWDMLWMRYRDGPPDWTGHRALVAALCDQITIIATPPRQDPDIGPSPAAYVRVAVAPDAACQPVLLDAAARVLLHVAQQREIDPAALLQAAGYQRAETAAGRWWHHPDYPDCGISETPTVLPAATPGVVPDEGERQLPPGGPQAAGAASCWVVPPTDEPPRPGRST